MKTRGDGYACDAETCFYRERVSRQTVMIAMMMMKIIFEILQLRIAILSNSWLRKFPLLNAKRRRAYQVSPKFAETPVTALEGGICTTDTRVFVIVRADC